jgi:hypothetical protein
MSAASTARRRPIAASDVWAAASWRLSRMSGRRSGVVLSHPVMSELFFQTSFYSDIVQAILLNAYRW